MRDERSSEAVPLDREWTGAVMPRPPRGCCVLFLLILRELEVSYQLRRVIRSGHRQGVASVRSLGGSLPVVDELVPSGVEPQARVFASRGQVLDRIHGVAIEGR